VILEAAELTVRYPGAARPAIDRVTFGLEGGTLAAIVGPNGSGKTTLVRALLGLIPAEAGECRLADHPVREWPRTEVARLVGVVSQQEERVFPMRVRDAVLLGRYARLGPLAPPSPDDLAAVADAMDRCDVAGLVDRSTDTLSGGEWQRVRVARALAQGPRLLMLDEPTSELDIRHEMEVFELVRRLVDDGLACLLITHHLNLAARFADRLLLLAGGRVVAEGPPASVLTEATVTRTFGWPVAVGAGPDGAPQIVPLRPPFVP